MSLRRQAAVEAVRSALRGLGVPLLLLLVICTPAPAAEAGLTAGGVLRAPSYALDSEHGKDALFDDRLTAIAGLTLRRKPARSGRPAERPIGLLAALLLPLDGARPFIAAPEMRLSPSLPAAGFRYLAQAPPRG